MVTVAVGQCSLNMFWFRFAPDLLRVAMIRKIQSLLSDMTGQMKYALVCETVDDCSIRFIATSHSQRAQTYTVMNLIQQVYIRRQDSNTAPLAFTVFNPMIPIMRPTAAELLAHFCSWQLFSVPVLVKYSWSGAQHKF